MKATLISLAFAFLATFALADAARDPIKANPTLERLSSSIARLEQNFTQIVHDFEVAISSGSDNSLAILKSHIVERVHNASAILVDINFEVQNMERNVFLDRISVDFVRLSIESYLRAFRQILLEITGAQQKVTQFVQYVHSDTIAVVQLLIHDKMDLLIREFRETDVLLQEAYYHNANSTVYSNQTKQQFATHFAQILANITVNRNEIAQEYHQEVDAIRVQGKVLSIVQQTQLEQEIDVLNYMSEFVQKYEQLFFKLN